MYGLSAMAASVAATGDDLTAATSGTFTFTVPARHAEVANVPTSGKYLYGLWNAATATMTTAAWDFVLAPGQSKASPPGIIVGTVSLISPNDMTKWTDFTVKGWV